MKYLVHNADGVILRQGEVIPSMLEQQARAGETVLAAEGNDADHYILNGVVTDKMAMAATLSGLTVSGLPVPATITIEHVRYDVTDGVAELSFNLPGTYEVKCEALHYLPTIFQVTA